MEYEFVSIPAKPEYKVDETYLDSLEKKLRIRFPEALRKYYLMHNGDQIATVLFILNGEKYTVLDFQTIKEGSSTLEVKIEQVMENPDLPHSFVPLARDVMNGKYYWDSRDEKIYYQDMEYGGITFICKGLDHFFNILNNAYWRDEDSPYDITEMTRRDLEMEKIEYLPLGSIVLLKEGVRKVLIIGRALNVKKGDKTYYFDYGGVLYPDGLTGDEMVYFNHDGVVRVYFYGYKDDDNDIMNENINNYVAEHPDLLRADPEKWNEE